MKQCETRGNEFILCAQYVIIRSISAFLPREVYSLPLGFRDLLHSSCGELWSRRAVLQKGASSLSPRYCKTWVAGLHGRQSAKSTRKTAIIITKSTENGADHARHFRLRENSRISDRELQIIESMRQRSHEVENWEALASMVPAGPPPPPTGGAANLHIHDATVTPKTALPKGVTERQNSHNTHREPSWAVDWRNDSRS